MNTIASIASLFDSIESKRASIAEKWSKIGIYFDQRLSQLNCESVSGFLNQAREEMLEQVMSDQRWLLDQPNLAVLPYARFTTSSLDLDETHLLNYDDMNRRMNFINLFNFVRFSHLHRLRLNEINFVEREFEFSPNFIAILAIGKVFIDLNCVRIGDEYVLYRRRLVVINSEGRKLHERDYRPIGEEFDTNTVPYVAKNRIFIFYALEDNPGMYQVDVFNFKLELQRTVSLSKDIRHLVSDHQELCIQTTTHLKFFDLNLNLKKVLGQKDDSREDFYIANLRLISFDESVLCLFSFTQVQVVFMSRTNGQTLSRANLNRTIFDYLSLFDLKHGIMLIFSKFFRNTPKQVAAVLNASGEILQEKAIEFFISEISRTANGSIILNRGFFYNDQANTETIRFKTF